MRPWGKIGPDAYGRDGWWWKKSCLSLPQLEMRDSVPSSRLLKELEQKPKYTITSKFHEATRSLRRLDPRNEDRNEGDFDIESTSWAEQAQTMINELGRREITG